MYTVCTFFIESFIALENLKNLVLQIQGVKIGQHWELLSFVESYSKVYKNFATISYMIYLISGLDCIPLRPILREMLP